MRLTILGRRWWLRFVRLYTNRGECDPPDKQGKEIRVCTSLKGEERLEVITHEMLHAAGWHIDEQFVTQFAADLARNLTKLGYTDGTDKE